MAIPSLTRQARRAEHAAPLALPTADLAVALALTLLALLFLSVPVAQERSLRIGENDREVIASFHPAEISREEGRTYRWTKGDARLRLAAQGLGEHLLALRLAAPQAGDGAPIATRVTLGAAPLATLDLTAQPRQYRLLLPGSALRVRDNDIRIVSPTFQAPGDDRELGVVLFEVRFAALQPQGWLVPAQAAALGLATLLLLLALRRCGVGPTRLLIAALFVAISLSMRHSDARFAERWDATLLTLGLALGLALAWAALRLAPARQVAEQPAAEPRRAPIWWPLLIFAGLSALQLGYLWPQLGSAIPGPPGDNFEYVWKLQWFADALLQRQSVAFVPHIYYPLGYELAHSEMTPANTLLGLPLTLLVGPTATFNLLLFASYLLTALFTMLLAERLGASRLGAIVAGIGVAFCAFRFARAMGHMPITGTQWIILALYGLESFIQLRRPRDAALAGLGAALAAWATWYYGATLPLLMALWLLLRWPWQAPRSLLAAWRTGLAAPLALVALVLPYAQPYAQLRGVSQSRHNLETVLALSAQPLDYLVPSYFHYLWGEQMRSLLAGIDGERILTATFGLLALALLGLWRWRRQRLAWAVAGVGLASFVASLGPLLRVGGLTLPLPVLLIYEHVPLLDSIRAWSRMAFYAQLCLGLLAGLALAGFATWRRWQQALALLVAALVLVESLNGPLTIVTSSTLARPVDEWIARQPGRSAVVQVPDIYTGYGEYYSLHHGRPLAVGYGTFPPRRASGDQIDLASFPSRGAVSTMRRLDVGFVIVRHDRMDAQRPGWRDRAGALAGVEQAYRDEAYTVFRVLDTP